jgi:hypothetical protein
VQKLRAIVGVLTIDLTIGFLELVTPPPPPPPLVNRLATIDYVLASIAWSTSERIFFSSSSISFLSFSLVRLLASISLSYFEIFSIWN